MLTTICTIVFVIVVLILAFFIKKDLYTYEHEADILNELDTFDTNFKAIQEMDITDYQLGSDHLYK